MKQVSMILCLSLLAACGALKGKKGDKGEPGERGPAGYGQNGIHGQPGQDNYTTTISKVEIVGDVREDDPYISCSARFITSDPNLRFRPKIARLFINEIEQAQFVPCKHREYHSGRVTIHICSHQDLIQADDQVQCQFEVYAENVLTMRGHEPVALHAMAMSPTVTALASDYRLLSVQEIEIDLGIVQPNQLVDIKLKPLTGPFSSNSQCRWLLTPELNDRADGLSSRSSDGSFVPVAGDPMTISTGYRLEEGAEVLNFEMICNGDPAYAHGALSPSWSRRNQNHLIEQIKTFQIQVSDLLSGQ